MRDRVDALFREVTLVTLALAIALGWTLVNVATALANAVTILLTHADNDELTAYQREQPLTWVIGSRVLTLGPLLTALIELAVVAAIAAYLVERRRPDAIRSSAKKLTD